MAKISVVINTLNEEKNLPGALSSMRGFADEVIVVDMKSDDKTVEIAKNAGAKVYIHERTGYVEPARNFAISKATGDWIFILDADERLPRKLKSVLREASDKSDTDYYRVARKNIVFGKWLKHSRWWPDYNIRFFRKNYVEWSEIIHSVPMTKGVGADLPAKELLSIEHHHYQSISQFIQRLDRYTNVQAKSKWKEGERFSWKKLIEAPSQEFVSRFFFGRGYKDGLHGLVLSILQAFSEAVVQMKLWELASFEEKSISLPEYASQIKFAQKEINFWIADAMVKESKGVSLISRFKRKFKLS